MSRQDREHRRRLAAEERSGPGGERFATGVVAALAAAVAGGVGVAAVAGLAGLATAVGVAQALLVVAWVLGTRLPGRVGGLLIGAGTAAAADVALLVADRPSLTPPLGVLALAFVALVAHQLARGVVRARVTESMSDIGLLCVALAGLAAFVALARSSAGPRVAAGAAVAAVAGLLVAALVDAVLPWPRFSREVPHGLLAVLLGTAAGAVAGALQPAGGADLSAAGGALLGAAVAGSAGMVAVGIGYLAETVFADPAPGPAARLALPYLRVAVPLAFAGPVAYAVGTWAVAG